MAMTKIIDPSGWSWDRPIAVMAKVSSAGLVGHDRSDFIKVAGHQFLHMIDNMKVAKDEVPIHLIALGAGEAYGCNRNGDFFSEHDCRTHHNTFQKYARWYRNHDNKQNSKSYGYIKQSAYNESMRRVELLCMLNAEKSAADRNGGFIADKELAKLAKGDDIPVSMACRIAYDVCSKCSNKAKTRAEYCTGIDEGGKCTGGGCKHNLTKIGEDGHILHVSNPNPHWFDISNVFRPADRIAYGAMADYLHKAASHAFTPGAELADMLGVTAPLNVCMASDNPIHWNAAINAQIKLAYALAATEQDLRVKAAMCRAFDAAVQPSLTTDQLMVLGGAGTEKAAAGLSAFADRKICMNLGDFANWTGKVASVSGAAQLLPSIYTRMVEHGTLENRLLNNKFACSTKAASAGQQVLARNLTSSHSLSEDAVNDRVMRSSIRTASAPLLKSGFENVKAAADDHDAVELAEAYALYKLAALHRMASFDHRFNLTASLAIAQNRMI